MACAVRRTVPKDAQRWQNIAVQVPGKTKCDILLRSAWDPLTVSEFGCFVSCCRQQCVARFKAIREMILKSGDKRDV